MAAVRYRHRMQPTWIAIGSRDAACRRNKRAAYSPLLSVWRKDKRPEEADVGGGGVPASPRIGCMGQVKGARRCSSTRGPAARGRPKPCFGSGGGSLAGLVMGLFGRRRRERKPRGCSRVRDVPSDSSSWGSAWGARAPAPVCLLDPPLPVVRPPARDGNASSLWERRRGGGKALQGLVFAQV